MHWKACERYIFHVMAYAFLSESDRKMGHFKKTNIKKWGIWNAAFRNKAILKQKRNRNWNEAFRKKCICHHVKNISFTCFLGHFIIPPVYSKWIAWNSRFFQFHFSTWVSFALTSLYMELFDKPSVRSSNLSPSLHPPSRI